MKLAFVVQRYGGEISGGAEQLCRALAERLAQRYQVSVLTTCARDHFTWANYYPSGESFLNGVRVHRFKIDQGRASDFNAFSDGILSRPHSLEDEERWLRKQGPNSQGLLAHIERHRRDYDLFVFFTYLYSPTYYGLPLVAEKSILVPTAHAEPALHLSIYRALFSRPRFIVYLSAAEQRLVQELFANESIPSALVGAGVEVPPAVNPAAFRAKYGLEGDILLYVGRVEGGKGCGELVDYFRRFLQPRSSNGSVALVLLGQQHMALPRHPAIKALGFVPEEEKFEALAAATVVVAPSPHESLSLTTLEGWLLERPALVNGRCTVLVEHCLQSNAGLYYENYREFAACLKLLLAQPRLRQALGANGRRYVEQNYSWGKVEAQWHSIIAALA